MEPLYAQGLAFLELSFILIVLMLLHSMRKSAGSAPFYVGLGSLMIFAQFITASGIRVSSGLPGFDFPVAPAIFFTPLMACLLIVYIIDGTLEAQHMLWALILGAAGIYLYLSFMTEHQIAITGYELFPDISPGLLQQLLFSSRIYMLASLLSILVQFITLPVMFQLLRNHHCRLGVATCGALIFSQVADAFFYELVTNYNWVSWWSALRQSYLARAGATIWVGLLTTLYLSLRNIPTHSSGESKNPFALLLAVVGGYGRAQQLQTYVREWEGRYRMVVENTHDFIFLIDQSGAILDANPRSLSRINYSLEEFHALNIKKILREKDDSPISWLEIWNKAYPKNPSENTIAHNEMEFIIQGKNGQQRQVDAAITPLPLQGTSCILLVARDITTRKRLEAEQKKLQTQLIHSQRMEAVGELAGGVAHDFNNLLHAIQASLDLLDKTLPNASRPRQLTQTIREATSRASRLTDQLLGFAREGKYQVEEIDVAELTQQTSQLFEPMIKQEISFRSVIHPDPMLVSGDFTQLQQVLLNLLLNAREALKQTENPRLILRAEPASEHTPGWQKQNAQQRFIAIRIKDNGCGMNEATRSRIFEPFFTTREHQGTGMGLAMVYGCIENHNGWIHVETEENKGTEFILFLPRST